MIGACSFDPKRNEKRIVFAPPCKTLGIVPDLIPKHLVPKTVCTERIASKIASSYCA